MPEEPSVQEEETVTQPETKQLTKTTKDKKYTVTVTYGDDAGLPEGTDLSLKTINTDDEKYADAKKAVASNKNVDASTLGMEALDITLTDSSHNKVEPDPKSNVQVSISINDLPDNIDSVDIHHITEEDTSNTVIKGIKRIGRIFNKDISVNNDKSSAVAENVHVINNTANAVFKTSSFSIYTIIWTTGNDSSTARIAQVKLHYVDEDGNELGDPTTQPTSEMLSQNAGGIITLKNYAEDALNSNATRMANYTFKEARMSDAKKGTVVTGFLAKSNTSESTTTYSLKYTTSDPVPSTTNDANWVNIPVDAITGANSNNVDVYLVYMQNGHLTVHYVDEAGNEISNSVTKYLSESSALEADGVNLTKESANTDWAQAITGYTFTSAHLNSALGDTVVAVKGIDNGFGLQAKNTSADSFTDATATDLYLVYSNNSKSNTVINVYYTDIAGVPIKDKSGNYIVRTYDPTQWQNGFHNFVDDAVAYTPDGYEAFDTNNLEANDYPYWWEKNSQTQNNKGNKIIYKTDNFIPNADTRFPTFGVEIFRDVRGYAIDTMLYSGDSIQIRRGNNQAVTLPGTEESPYKVYIMYKKQLTIHDIDANGNELGSRTSNNWYVGYDPKGWNSTYSYGTSASNTVITANKTYGTPTKIYIQSANNQEISSQSISNFQIAWQFSGAAAYPDINTANRDHTYGLIKPDHTGKSNGTGKWITRIHTGNGSSGSDYTTIEGSLITDVYMKYDYSAKTVTVHHIDSDGKLIAKDSTETISKDKTITPSISTDYAIDGYTLAGGKVDMTAGSSAETFTEGTDFYSYTVDKSGSTFASTYKTSAEANNVSPTNQNEIWLVYAKNKTGSTDENVLTNHYGYMTDNTDQTTKFNAFTGLDTTTYPGTVGISESTTSVVPTQKTVTSGDKTYSYVGTYVSNTDSRSVPVSSGDPITTGNGYNRLMTDGLKVTNARIHNGKLQYLVVSKIGNNDETEVDMTMLRRNRWGFTTDSGRSYTLRKDGNNLSIVYSLGGTSAFDLNLTSTETNGGVTTNTYTATSGSEGRGVVYTIKEIVTDGSANPTYKLSVSEWVENKQSDLYHIYRETTTGSVSVAIGNEVVYTGNLIATVNGLPEGATISAYEWQKSDNTVDSGNNYKDVARKQNGNEWNINYLPQERSWLNLVADDGEMSTSNGRTSVKYKVRVKYKVGEGEEQTSDWSSAFTVPYYDQLENGGFEKPEKTSTDGESLQYSNAAFKSEGIWQTTGLGSDKKLGRDIEIVNTRNIKFRASYGWKKSLNSDGAKEGYQFAELNCEAAGALYQDVVTHPNEYLNYWLSHRARGNIGWSEERRDEKTYYDTMYLVIMPTSLAMTSAEDGGELITQDDLTKYINAHGGYDSSSTNNRNEEENTITYKDMKSGVLIARITSDNLNWHNISETNGYIATSNLTRFFFVAGPCASSNPTVGNFIDDVGLSQSLPTPTTPHYHMVVKKTFSGLTTSEIASLASNKAETGKEFKLTIKEYTDANGTTQSTAYYENDQDTSATNRAKYTRLNNAVLSFTADASNNFTMTATTTDPNDSSNTVNLLTGSNRGVVTEDPLTGDVTMTWTLYSNYIESGSRYFTVTESGQDVTNFTLTENISGTVAHGETNANPALTDITGNNSTGVTSVITVKDKDTARVNYRNSYRDSRFDGNPMITVRKTFSGITSYQVKQMIASGDNQYKVQLKKDDTTLNLVGDATQPYSGTLPTGVSSVRFGYEDGANGSAVLTWHILGKTTADNWVTNGDYTVSESGFKSQSNEGTEINGNPSEITVNGDKVILSGDNWPSDQKVTVGETTVSNKSNITVKTEGAETNSTITAGTAYSVSSSTQIIAAKYTTGNGTATNFIVWTADALGLNDRAKVISQLSQVTGFTDLTAANTTFQNGERDEITVPSVGSVTNAYDGGGHLLITFNNTTGSTNAWESYFASTYTGAGEPEVSIANIYEPYVKLKKVNADNSTIVLADAKFKIYKKDTSGNKTYLKKDGSKWSAASSEEDATLFTSDANGNIDIGRLVPAVSDVTYYFEETDAPSGYNKLAKPIAFTVKNDGTVEASNVDDADNSVATLEWDSSYYTITVKNTSGVLLPITGGIGTTIFYVAGGAIIVIAVILLMRRKKE